MRLWGCDFKFRSFALRTAILRSTAAPIVLEHYCGYHILAIGIKIETGFDWGRGIQMTRIAPLADVKARLSAYIEESQTEGPIVITRNGKAVAVLVSPVDDDDVESLVLARSPRLQKLLKKSRASIAAGRGLSANEFWSTVSKRRRTMLDERLGNLAVCLAF